MEKIDNGADDIRYMMECMEKIDKACEIMESCVYPLEHLHSLFVNASWYMTQQRDIAHVQGLIAQIKTYLEDNKEGN